MQSELNRQRSLDRMAGLRREVRPPGLTPGRRAGRLGLVYLAGAVLVCVGLAELVPSLLHPARRSFTFSGRVGLPSLSAVAVVGLDSNPNLTTPVPARESARARRAERIASADAVVARLVRLGGGHQSGPATPWTSNGPLGEVITYRLKRPIAVDSDLPYAAIPPDAKARGNCVRPYAPGWAHVRGSGVTALSVLVDLRRDRVAEIGVNPKRGVVSPVPLQPYPSCLEIQP